MSLLRAHTSTVKTKYAKLISTMYRPRSGLAIFTGNINLLNVCEKVFTPTNILQLRRHIRGGHTDPEKSTIFVFNP